EHRGPDRPTSAGLGLRPGPRARRPLLPGQRAHVPRLDQDRARPAGGRGGPRRRGDGPLGEGGDAAHRAPRRAGSGVRGPRLGALGAGRARAAARRAAAGPARGRRAHRWARPRGRGAAGDPV
ncbi:MAG: hypothetical protein AVDCRST_MAG36-59, partial [uncultured Nocardioidaceae bacterium]